LEDAVDLADSSHCSCRRLLTGFARPALFVAVAALVRAGRSSFVVASFVVVSLVLVSVLDVFFPLGSDFVSGVAEGTGDAVAFATTFG
jgi:hypothetical protein